MAIQALIVSAGKGSRMKGPVPKQYLPLQGIPVLGRTLLAFNQCAEVDRIISVVPAKDVSYCRDQLFAGLKINKPIRVLAGGKRRQDSVWNGILSIEDPGGTIVIHDGVRPLIHPNLISRCIHIAEDTGACILGIPLQDTLKSVEQNEHIQKTLLRKNMWLAQTPQAFQYELIREAHEKAQRDGFEATDDASLVERIGRPVHILMGSKYNLKITTEEDFILARAVLSQTELK